MKYSTPNLLRIAWVSCLCAASHLPAIHAAATAAAADNGPAKAIAELPGAILEPAPLQESRAVNIDVRIQPAELDTFVEPVVAGSDLLLAAASAEAEATFDHSVIFNDVMHPGRGAAAQPLILSARPLGDAMDQLTEDLRIMDRILDDQLAALDSGGKKPEAMGIHIMTSAGNQFPEAMYLDGYGVLFKRSVGFPLWGETKLPQEPKAEKPADTAWERARKELAEGPASGAKFPFNNSIYSVNAVGFISTTSIPYDADKVARLRESLADALKSATNIRNLNAEDRVAVSVFGPRSAAGGGPALETSDVVVRGGSIQIDGKPFAGAGGGTVLHLSATKKDVDAFAAGRLDRGQFLDRIKSQTYPVAFSGGAGSLKRKAVEIRSSADSGKIIQTR